MGRYQLEEAAIIDAPSEKVFRIIADYHEGHQAILPKRYFTEMQVSEGGYGAGTRVKVKMEVFGTKMSYHFLVSEPEPGCVLREEDPAAGVVTTFTIDSLDHNRSKVTISTSGKTSSGLKGWLEKLTTPVITKRIYREELALLAEVAEK